METADRRRERVDRWMEGDDWAPVADDLKLVGEKGAQEETRR